ncbi:ras-related protein Rab-8B-like [Pholidichthys leucotaenia]
MSEFQDHLVKLVIIGDVGVGKSRLLHRFIENDFNTTEILLGIDFKIKTIDLDGKKIKLQIWDLPGQQSYRTILSSYYSRAMGILLVYDITDSESFCNIRNWILDIDELAMEYGVKFLETSAKSNINVDQAFFTLTTDVFSRLRVGGEDDKGDKGDHISKNLCSLL